MGGELTDGSEPLLTARADGLVGAAQPAPAPFMAPRLQGEVAGASHIDLSLWGSGRIGRVRFTPLKGPFVHGPNRIEADGGGVFVAQSAPVLVVRGARLAGLHPARRAAWWDRPTDDRAAVAREGARRSARLPWGAIVVEQRGPDLVVAAGVDAHEAGRGLALSVADIAREADAYVARCDVLPTADPLLRSLALQAAHAALSSIRQDERGRFAGLAAGEAYSAPARTYYRDGYWTAQALLRLAPEAVREEIDLLALGVQADGEAPSGLILSAPSQSEAWEAARRSSRRLASAHQRPLDWWSDHFDSPLLFVLMLGDYARATGDAAAVHRHWPKVRAVFARYQAMARVGEGLPRKPRNDRDWADNVFREGLVAYDLGLWVGALDAIQRMGRAHDPTLAEEAAKAAAAGRTAIDAALWRPQGWYADYAAPDGFIEEHLALDSLTLLRFDAASPQRALAVLEAARSRLETRANAAQPWGDWGVMCAFPPFARRADTRAKSAFAFRYHNGGDWPWLDGLYAGERLRRGLSGWRYPLLRWWETCLARGWLGAVEHFSPPFGRGSLLQAWSSLPLAVALNHRETVLAGDAEAPPA
ncbi:MAG: GH116 family glycosyl hydrolase [Caulobacteraceae bacterium]|nr:GH116 family glycosyl hydrolase [Caulobacteraceae bacterium]